MHEYFPAWFLLIFCRYSTDVTPSGRLGPFHIVVHSGLQSAVQLIGPIFPTVSIAVKLCCKGIMLTCLGPSKTKNNNNNPKVVCCPASYTYYTMNYCNTPILLLVETVISSSVAIF